MNSILIVSGVLVLAVGALYLISRLKSPVAKSGDVILRQALRLVTYKGRRVLNACVMIINQIEKDYGKILWIEPRHTTRTDATQKRLRRELGYLAAKLSPHQYHAAVDMHLAKAYKKKIGGGVKQWNREGARLQKEAAKKLGLFQYMRRGYVKYPYHNCHFDFIDLLFRKSLQSLSRLLPDSVYKHETVDGVDMFAKFGRNNPRCRDWVGGVDW